MKDMHRMVVYKGVFSMRKYFADDRQLSKMGAKINSENTWF